MNVTEQSIFGLFFGRAEQDIHKVFKHLTATAPYNETSIFHKCLLALLEFYSSAIEKWRDVLDKEVQAIESKTGKTSLSTRQRWERDPYRYEFLTREIHSCNNNLVFLANISEFEKDLGEFCAEVMDIYVKLRAEVTRSSTMPHCERDQALEYLRYCTNDTKSRQRLIQCLKLRVQTQINLVSKQNQDDPYPYTRTQFCSFTSSHPY